MRDLFQIALDIIRYKAVSTNSLRSSKLQEIVFTIESLRGKRGIKKAEKIYSLFEAVCCVTCVSPEKLSATSHFLHLWMMYRERK